jgi:predicted NBD/HSP70 family sugar kinase
MYLTIDIGGTKTLVANFDSKGNIQGKVRFETPTDYEAFIKLLGHTIEENKAHQPYKLVVAGAPGRIDRTSGTGIAFGNLAWENIPLGKDIENITGMKTLVENDANLAGLSEAMLVRKQYRKVLYVTISTGIGGILITDGKIDPELADTEFGHMMFEHQGKLQKWQEFASGKAIYKKFGMPASEINDPSAWYVISRNIALGLTNVVSTLTPDVVIIGGGVGTHFDKFGERLQEEMVQFGSDVVTVPPILAAQRAEDAVLYGCYELAKQSS